jgi:hypothetical protein
MQLATSGHVTGLMYKQLSFRSVSKPGRITAPGFVLCTEERRYGSLANNGASGNDSCGKGWQLGRGGQCGGVFGRSTCG